MPPPTSSLKPAAGAKANGSVKTDSSATAGSAKPSATQSGEEKRTTLAKPDKASYDAEQDAVNKEIAELKTKLDAIRARINLGQAPKGDDRRSQLKAEMDSLRTEQGKYKADRGKLLDEVKRLQEGLQRKIKDAQAARGKATFKNVDEVDDRLDSLNKQIESGTMKLVDEKKALQEVSNLRRMRKQLEATGSVDDAIAADKAKIDEVRKQLDDPEARKTSDKFDVLKKEMDGLRDEGNKAYEERNKLFEERNALSAQMDELYGKKRESAQKYREDNDAYYAKVQSDRQARNERFKADKAAEDSTRREEEIERLREEAKQPAFGAEIEDCKILTGWFTGKYVGDVPATNAAGKAPVQVEGVKELERRQVETQFEGMTLKKKGGDDEEMGGFFGGMGGKGKKGKGKQAQPQGKGKASGTATPTTDGASTPSGSGAVNLPMSLLSALLALGIPPPTGKGDVQRTIDDLETKRAWYEANSAAKTKAEIERVEKLVAKMQKKNKNLTEEDEEDEVVAESNGTSAETEAINPEARQDVMGGDIHPDHPEVVGDAENGGVGGSKEPVHTVAGSASVADPGLTKTNEAGHVLPKDASPTEEIKHVDSVLEEIKESGEDA